MPQAIHLVLKIVYAKTVHTKQPHSFRNQEQGRVKSCNSKTRFYFLVRSIWVSSTALNTIP